jgi:hypothetical protein
MFTENSAFYVLYKTYTFTMENLAEIRNIFPCQKEKQNELHIFVHLKTFNVKFSVNKCIIIKQMQYCV